VNIDHAQGRFSAGWVPPVPMPSIIDGDKVGARSPMLTGGYDNWLISSGPEGLRIARMKSGERFWDATPPGWTGHHSAVNVENGYVTVVLNTHDEYSRRELRASVASLEAGCPRWERGLTSWVPLLSPDHQPQESSPSSAHASEQ